MRLSLKSFRNQALFDKQQHEIEKLMDLDRAAKYGSIHYKADFTGRLT